MKNTIITTMFTTGASIIISAVFFVFTDIHAIPVHVLFEIFGANIVINFGLLLTHKFESRNVFFEYLLDISYIIVVLVVFGAIFNWYVTMPVWALAVMAIVIYLLAIALTIARIQKDTQKINALLQKRDEKQTDSAS